MPLSVGFYICHCGINIASKVRVEEVAEYVSHLKNVTVSRDYKFMCSDPGQELIETDIREHGLNRVVVASCSPRLHEKTFQGACRRAGLNPYYFQMASVREQVSWVTEDADVATRKAKTLAAAAVNRVQFHYPLETREVGVHPDIMVVGGGIAGMQAALDLGSAGHKVYLVEKDTTIGGHMLQFDKTFPTLDCAACIGTPKMVEVGQNDNIELLSYSEVQEVSGYIGNYTVTVRRKPRYVVEGVCTGCGECMSVCPVSMPSGWDEGLAERKAIYRSFPQAVPITYVIDKKDRAPCTTTCPAGINVQGYVQLIGQGKYREAVQLIMERLPLPGVLGRVCPHPCESVCRRAEVDSAVSIRELKRFAADQVDLSELPVPEIEDRPEKIAVIGAGPAGLTAAYYLRLKGYPVTIFEGQAVLGGMLRLGIPDYRLPPSVLDREIDFLLNTGIQTRCGEWLGRDFTFESLKEEGFSAVFMGTGAHFPMKMGIAGEDTETGVMDAIEFLRRANLGEAPETGKSVAVIGGGNVAVDAARSARRLGADSVSLVYRRSRAEMPAYEEEITDAEAEGVRIYYLTAPVQIMGQGGRASALQCIRTELGQPDQSGRRRPVPVEGSEFEISCDLVIPAIGQSTGLADQLKDTEIEISRRGTLIVDPNTLQTSIPYVFASGDAVTGPASVIEAVAQAHKAVAAIDRYIQGADLAAYAEELAKEPAPGSDWKPIPENLKPESRCSPSHQAAPERIQSFSEVSAGLVDADARKEAARCLNCGGCCECMQCVNACQANAIDHQMAPEIREVKVGSLIVATGYDLMDPTPMKPYGYGKYPNVYTGLEFERLSNATGPTGGQILIKDEKGEFTKKPESVAILHCIGSRDVNYHEYCSRVCCMYALKFTHLIKDKVGHDTPVYDFYIDQRCFGKGYEAFYRKCQEEGTTFIRGKVAEITDEARTPEETGKLVAIAEDTLLGRPIRVPVDMVILCVAMEARPDAQEVSRTFGMSVGADGFFLEEHPKLGPLETPTGGVFIAGACQGPKDIPDTVAQASGAASKALALATRGKVQIPSAISSIDPDLCAGCQMCIALCPYSAIEFDGRRKISVVNEAVCKGCGSCAAICPSGAAQVRHFKEKQLMSELDGLFNAIYAVGQ
ncbi:MAG: FAD-dependent oxidoreductase [Desulfobacterales bacterium]|nr:FAD-dependent oxidoreductase [Desulfobacterales bacterium]